MPLHELRRRRSQLQIPALPGTGRAVKLRVTFLRDSLILARIDGIPGALERFVGRREFHATAVAVPDARGGRLWLWDSSSRPIIHRRIIAALERERARLLAGPPVHAEAP